MCKIMLVKDDRGTKVVGGELEITVMNLAQMDPGLGRGS